MVSVHHGFAFAAIAAALLAVVAGGLALWRARGAGRWLAHVLALAQTLLIAQVALGLMLLGQHHRAADRLHYLYGTLSLAAVLSPWLYAPREPRRRLVWFVAATLIAAALGVRAYMTAT
jgi:hypothetical protein